MAGRKKKVRWLARRGTVDYGPYSEDELKECIARREVDLGTLVCPVGTHNWQTIGEISEFRDYYSGLHTRWAREELEASVEAHERKMAAMDKVKGGTWKLVVVGLLVVTGLGSWVVYRILNAEPTGIMDTVALPEMAALPTPPPPAPGAAGISEAKLAKANTVKRLREHVNYNTGGVGAEGTETGPATSMAFDENGRPLGGPGLTQGQINAIIANVRPGLLRCANKAAGKFSKVNISFLVKSGRLGGITLSKQALSVKPFVVCVKGVLRGASVPTFGGSERRVTIPIAFQ